MILRILLAMLLVLCMIFLIATDKDPVQIETAEYKEQLQSINDELCGIEHDIYQQEVLYDDIREEISKK